MCLVTGPRSGELRCPRRRPGALPSPPAATRGAVPSPALAVSESPVVCGIAPVRLIWKSPALRGRRRKSPGGPRAEAPRRAARAPRASSARGAGRGRAGPGGPGRRAPSSELSPRAAACPERRDSRAPRAACVALASGWVTSAGWQSRRPSVGPFLLYSVQTSPLWGQGTSWSC